MLHLVLSVPCINTYIAAYQIEVMSKQSEVVVSEYRVEDITLRLVALFSKTPHPDTPRCQWLQPRLHSILHERNVSPWLIVSN
jgi:hypothetical protein